MDNYEKSAQNAKKLFLSRDQEAIIRKFQLSWDKEYLYPRFLGNLHRLSRSSGSLERREGETWVSANSFDEIMTLLDILCDAEDNRCLTGNWKSTQNFGHQFHRNLLENQKDPLADFFDADPGRFSAACQALGGRSLPYGDLAYALPILGELEIGVFFWHSDLDFPAQLRFFWDENALQYLKYETMHYAIGLVRSALSRYGLQGTETVI